MRRTYTRSPTLLSIVFPKLYSQHCIPQPRLPGKCLSYPVAHQYARQIHPAPADAPDEPDTVMFYDMIDYSCLNGWSMGNIAASSKDLAMFFRDLFGNPRHGAILKPDTVAAMLHWQNLTNGWTDGYAERGVWYGLATYRSGEFGFLAVPGTGDPASTILYAQIKKRKTLLWTISQNIYQLHSSRARADILSLTIAYCLLLIGA